MLERPAGAHVLSIFTLISATIGLAFESLARDHLETDTQRQDGIVHRGVIGAKSTDFCLLRAKELENLSFTRSRAERASCSELLPRHAVFNLDSHSCTGAVFGGRPDLHIVQRRNM